MCGSRFLSVQGEMEQSETPSVVTTLSIQIDTSKAHHGNNEQHHNRNSNDGEG
jgi:plant G-box-binding factor